MGGQPAWIGVLDNGHCSRIEFHSRVLERIGEIRRPQQLRLTLEDAIGRTAPPFASRPSGEPGYRYFTSPPGLK